MRLELGCGERPTPGYLHNDLNPFDGVELVGPAWEVQLPDESCEQVIALGVIEHLTYDQAHDTLANVRRMLQPGGMFLFDAPDLVAWCKYVADYHNGIAIPWGITHVYATLYGWQRWPGDEHKSGWDDELVEEALAKAGFRSAEYGVDLFLSRGLDRRRMHRPLDAHIYCAAVR